MRIVISQSTRSQNIGQHSYVADAHVMAHFKQSITPLVIGHHFQLKIGKPHPFIQCPSPHGNRICQVKLSVG